MRAIVALSVLALVTADIDIPDKAKCVVDGGEAAADLMDAAIFIWGAKQRCGQDGAEIKCEIDIASAVQSVTSMTNTILKVVGRCGHDFDPDCGRAATRLVKGVAGLSSANGGIKQKCAADWVQPAAGGAMVGGNLPGTNWMHGASALCVLDVKNSAKNLLKVIKNFVKIEKKEKCEDKNSRKCTGNVLKVVGALAGLGEYLAASLGDCQAPSQMAHDAECAQEAIMLAHHLVKVAEAGVEISKKCAQKEEVKAPDNLEIDYIPVADNIVPRLYEEHSDAHANGSFANIVLGAFLPVTAVVSYVAGRFYANHRSRMQETRELVSDHE